MGSTIFGGMRWKVSNNNLIHFYKLLVRSEIPLPTADMTVEAGVTGSIILLGLASAPYSS